MFKLFKFLFLLILSIFNFTDAHTNQICTSTGGDNSQCGTAKFILTTYHTCPTSGQVPGKLHIQTPIGNIHTFGFTSYCKMSGFKGPGPNGIIPNHQCSQELSNKCSNTNSDITCYYKPDGINW